MAIRPCRIAACALFVDHWNRNEPANMVANGYIVKHKETGEIFWICSEHYQQSKHNLSIIDDITGLRASDILPFLRHTPKQLKIAFGYTLPDGDVEIETQDAELLDTEKGWVARAEEGSEFDLRYMYVLEEDDESITLSRQFV